MRTQTTMKLLLALTLIAPLGCGDDEDNSGGNGVPDASVPQPDAGGDDGPPMPMLGAQLDRMGRPAVSTALIATFSGDMMAKGETKNAYNQNGDPSTWVAEFTPAIAGSLAIYDALDTTCGNQLLAMPAMGGNIPPTRYAPLGSVLATDLLWVNVMPDSCDGIYLAVEANATGTLANNDCGGRKPTTDVIRTSYAVLSGAGYGIDPMNDPDDGIVANDVEFMDTFPFFAAPQ